MAKKKKQNTLAALLEVTVIIIVYIIIAIMAILKFTYDLISFYMTGYRKKSGNGFFKTYFDKGYRGEFILYRKVVRRFGKEYVFTNLYLDNVNTDKTEIDVLAISNKKVYVFEMKNYRGYIYGSSGDRNWTQVFNRWSKFQFYNPLRQNYAHAKAVENYLVIDESKIERVVVFSNSSKLKKMNLKKDDKVVKIKGINRFIKEVERKSDSHIKEEDKLNYSTKMIAASNVSDKIKKMHIEQVRAIVRESKN